MTISDRRLDRYRLGELSPEEASELLKELEARGELHRLEALEAEAEAFLEHYPPGPAVQHLRADLRRIAREPEPARSSRSGWALVVVGLLVVVAVPFALLPGSEEHAAVDAAMDAPKQRFINWDYSDVDCVGVFNCRDAATKAYQTAKELEQATDPASQYRAYAEYDRAELLLNRANVEAPEMSDIGSSKAALKTALDARFTQRRVNYLNYRNRKMYREMAGQLAEIKADFPDERSLYHQWAVENERKMKDDGIFPVTD